MDTASPVVAKVIPAKTGGRTFGGPVARRDVDGVFAPDVTHELIELTPVGPGI